MPGWNCDDDEDEAGEHGWGRTVQTASERRGVVNDGAG